MCSAYTLNMGVVCCEQVRTLKERIEVAVAEHDQLRLMLHRSKTEHDGLVRDRYKGLIKRA